MEFEFSERAYHRVDESEIQLYIVGDRAFRLSSLQKPFLKVLEIQIRSGLTGSYYQCECKSSVHSRF